MFRKSEYYDILKTQREFFVNNHFRDDILSISKKLKEDAEKMKVCNIVHDFIIPELFDLSKVENILVEYFRDCGYCTSYVRDEKEGNKIIRITLL